MLLLLLLIVTHVSYKHFFNIYSTV